jgi:type VI secretion system protein ImpK
MYNVPELFSELFAYVLLFEQMSLQGAPLPSYEEVRSTIAVILGRQEAYAKRQGMREQEYHNALFAIVAWVDETILRQTHWEYYDQWNTFPLQLEYYQTRNGGEELFERLQSLHADQTEIREIYYLCLGLGFSGQYFLGIEDELKLNQIRHEQARYLSLPIEDVRDVDRLIPQPYEVTPPEGRPIKTPLLQYLLKGGIILIAAIPLLLLLILALLPI